MIRLGVDAFNLAADRRGMGRYARLVLDGLRRIGGVDVCLVVRSGPDTAKLREEFALEQLESRRVRRGTFDAVWYPWNAMRFAPHAPSVVTIHDPFAFSYPHRNFVARMREQAPIRRALRKANRVLAVSEWTAGELRRLFGLDAGRIDISAPGLDPWWQHVDAPVTRAYVLFVAGREPRKNATLLLDAFEAAFSEDAGVELVVAGTLDAADESRLACMQAPHRRVHPFDEALRALYSGATAVAVPSIAEGFGLPVLEAMACGAPVLASNAAALPEAAGGAALLLPPDDVNAWRDALRRVAADADLRESLRARGSARAAKLDPLAPAKSLLESLRRSLEDAR